MAAGLLAAACVCGAAQAQDAPPAPNPDTRGPFTLPSAAYPGTQHTYWVYVPAQYAPSEPASLMIFDDGQLRSPAVKR